MEQTLERKKEVPSLEMHAFAKGLLKLSGKWLPVTGEPEPSFHNLILIAFREPARDVDADKERKKREKMVQRQEEILDTTTLRIKSILDAQQEKPSEKKALEKKLMDCVNTGLLALAIEPISEKFFSIVFGSTNLMSNTRMITRVEKFNILAMYFYGSFEKAYHELRQSDEIRRLWYEIFPADKNPGEVERREKLYSEARLDFNEIKTIAGEDLWCLGYLAYEHADNISKARSELLPHFEDALKNGVNSEKALDTFVEKRTGGKWSGRVLTGKVNNAVLSPDSNPCVGKDFERLPATYRNKTEEELRDHLLLYLEPRYEGVGGETFNRTGKTDILIRYENSNVFVAECKFWTGPKQYLGAITQLLGYLTWRDSKAAVVIFVKSKDFSSVLQSVRETTPTHTNYLGYVDNRNETWFNYRVHIDGDRNREVKLAVLLFHMSECQ